MVLNVWKIPVNIIIKSHFLLLFLFFEIVIFKFLEAVFPKVQLPKLAIDRRNLARQARHRTDFKIVVLKSLFGGDSFCGV